MDVVGYYSLIYNTYEEDRHPEWKMRGSEGKSHRDNGGRYGLCCPNNAEYRKFVFAQIAEIMEYFTLDGMFYDMLFWPDICRCGSCKKRFFEETGLEIPEKTDWYDEKWLLFDRKRCEWMGEFAMTVTEKTKQLNPNISVEHNYASGVAGDWYSGATELVSEACDYTGGDLYGDLYNHSFTCKYYMNITKNPPFEYMTCRCANYLAQHTITKTKEALELEIMLTAAHHGASFIIDAIDPSGKMDSRVYEKIGAIFSKHMEYEPYFTGGHIADVGVYYSTSSRYNREGGDFTNKNCAVNTVKTLIENHVPVGVVSNGCPNKIKDFKFIFAPYIFNMGEDITEKLLDYVREGGNLYFSGAGNEKLLKELAGAAYTKNLTKENKTYIAPKKQYENVFDEFNEDFPLPIDYRLPIAEITEPNLSAAAYITLPYTARSDKKFASIHSDPPGIKTSLPALIIKKYGKGNVIWSAAPIENDERIHYKRLLINLMHMFIGQNDLSVYAAAAKNVEIVSFKTNGGYLVGAVDLKCTEELVPIRSFCVSVKTGKPAKNVVKLPEQSPVEYFYSESEGKVTFNTGELTMFAMYKICVD
jgi:hypothetical protein